MNQSSRKTLELFTEKADKLSKLSFFRSNKGLSFNVSGDRTALTVQTEGPSPEQIDAFVLTFRFFYQKNDGISLRSLSESVAIDPGVSDQWKEQFAAVRGNWNEWLDQLPDIQLHVDNLAPPTRRQILDVYLYGDLSHMNEEKRKLFERWSEFVPSKALLDFFFLSTLIDMSRGIFFLRDLSSRELAGDLAKEVVVQE